MVRTGLCNLVQKQSPNGLLTRGLPHEVCSSSTMVQCTAMYSPQTCPTKNSFKVKLAKTDSAASCGTKDLKIQIYLKMLTQLWEVWIWFRYVSMMMYDDHIIHDNDAFFVFFIIGLRLIQACCLGFFHHMWKWIFSMEMYSWHFSDSLDPCAILVLMVWISVYPKKILSTLSGWNNAGARAEAN